MTGNRIKQIRKLKGLIQKEFAESLGISANYLSEIESGKKQPSETILLLIEVRYAINAEWLKTGHGEMYYNQVAESSAEKDGIILKICKLLKNMDEDKKVDVLKYAEEKKFLGELMKKYNAK